MRGAVLQFAIGTGRVAVPLAERGLGPRRVHRGVAFARLRVSHPAYVVAASTQRHVTGAEDVRLMPAAGRHR